MKFCKCENPKYFKVNNIEVTISARAKPFKFFQKARICDACNLPIVNDEILTEWQNYADRLFIEKEGRITPEKLKEIREKTGLSRVQFAQYLRITPPTVHGWEVKGYPMNRAMEELICLKCSPEYLRNNEGEINRLKKNFPGDLTGHRFFVDNALKNTFLFLVRNVKTTKLFFNKILFYIDFLHFKKHGISITGSKYVPLQYGPCPDRFQEHIQRYIDQGVLIPLKGYEFEVAEEPDMSIFSEEEMETINYVLSFCKEDGGKRLYDLSHEEEGYLKTPACQPISYGQYASELKI